MNRDNPMHTYLNTAVEELKEHGFLSEATRQQLTPIEYQVVCERAQEENT